MVHRVLDLRFEFHGFLRKLLVRHSTGSGPDDGRSIEGNLQTIREGGEKTIDGFDQVGSCLGEDDWVGNVVGFGEVVEEGSKEESELVDVRDFETPLFKLRDGGEGLFVEEREEEKGVISICSLPRFLSGSTIVMRTDRRGSSQ